MFTRLFTHELRVNAKQNLTAIGLSVLVAALALAIVMLRWPLISTMSATVVTLAAFACPAAVLVISLQNFWRTMYGDRGYFTMALPTRGRNVFLAKTIHGYLAFMVAVTVALVLQLALWWAQAYLNGVDVGARMDQFATILSNIDPVVLAIAVASVPIMGFTYLFPLAAIMSIGAGPRWNHLGFGAPVVGYMIYYVTGQVFGVLGFLLPGGVDITTGRFTWEWSVPSLIDAIVTGGQPKIIGFGAIVLQLLLSAVLTCWGVRAVEKHTALR
ncbi:hypothetical protein I6B53_02995 [Schaalia sp. 19OD2882]|uniref:hypothetical protein n=1 Tax=Schaalia sp. 19OD2882 TaxID=2794089 RepID=UPI001C1ED082|nr:hypothetical protein [Schaalia sp. 19OD2882]QWW20082.1 hypothetical protein I6B53_02995 [Schaalia sp. 19OD2882]